MSRTRHAKNGGDPRRRAAPAASIAAPSTREWHGRLQTQTPTPAAPPVPEKW